VCAAGCVGTEGATANAAATTAIVVEISSRP
jgi:hypothetical protein